MPTSEDLVPTGQPYGSRQETVAGMQQAGLPTSTAGGPPPPPGGPPAPTRQPHFGSQGAPVSGLDILRGRSPADFPFINQAPTQSPAADQPDSMMSALAASAQSSFAQAVMTRLQSKR